MRPLRVSDDPSDLFQLLELAGRLRQDFLLYRRLVALRRRPLQGPDLMTRPPRVAVAVVFELADSSPKFRGIALAAGSPRVLLLREDLEVSHGLTCQV